MGGLFDKPKVVRPAPPKPSPPVPSPEAGLEAGEEARRRRPRGFRETFLTGDLIPAVDVNDNLRKKKVLG